MSSTDVSLEEKGDLLFREVIAAAVLERLQEESGELLKHTVIATLHNLN